MFTGIQHTEIDSVWSDVLPFLKSACSRSNGRYNPEDFKLFLKSRNMQLWIYKPEEIQAICITEIVNYPRKKYAQIRVGTGINRKNWQHFISVIEEWAKAQGCEGIESIARKGWWRAFYRLIPGWQYTHIFIEKDFK